MTGADIVRQYGERKLRFVTWSANGDSKGPQYENWTTNPCTDYQDNHHRIGLFTGYEVTPQHFLHDLDLDWQPGVKLASALLPATNFLYGRPSKTPSHIFYTSPEALPSFKYIDPTDKTTLLELRGTTLDGAIGCMSMAPPSPWSKNGARELLTFVRMGEFAHVQNLKQESCYTAIALLLAKHFGPNGFGHEPRLAWAGFLLRMGVAPEDCIRMGEALSLHYCDNRELSDVRTVVESTVRALASTAHKKVKGAPALAKILGQHGKVIVERIREWLGRDSEFLRARDGIIVPNSQANIRRALRLLNVDLSYNKFAEKTLVVQPDASLCVLEDGPLEDIWLTIDTEYRFRPDINFFRVVVNSIARENTFHPVKQYLDGLTWDGTPRINTWLQAYGGAEDHDAGEKETSYLEAVSSIVLIAAVRRVRDPGVKYDEMLVLESAQGLNKSSMLRALCPNDAWFSDDLPLNVDSKQIIERTLGKWIIEASELTGKRKAEFEQIKSMMSRQVDGPARMAYAHMPLERARHFVIIGTTNAAEYLSDSTGARRFWPVAVKKFDVEAIRRDRDQLWAEACVRETAGESIRLPERLWPAASHHQEQRREVDPWEETLRTFLFTIAPAADDKRRVATNALWEALAIPVERRDRRGGNRLSECMQKLGFKRGTLRFPQLDGTCDGYSGLLLEEPAQSDEPARPPSGPKEEAPF